MAKKSKIEEVVASHDAPEVEAKEVEPEVVRGTFKLASGHIQSGIIKGDFLHADDGTVNSLEGAKPYNK